MRSGRSLLPYLRLAVHKVQLSLQRICLRPPVASTRKVEDVYAGPFIPSLSACQLIVARYCIRFAAE